MIVPSHLSEQRPVQPTPDETEAKLQEFRDSIDNIDAALKDFAAIVSGQVGPHALEQALSWAAQQAWEEGGLKALAEPA